MYRMYHIPRRGKQKDMEVATDYWHHTASDAEAHSRWWTRVRCEKWFYKDEPLPEGVRLEDFGRYLIAYPQK